MKLTTDHKKSILIAAIILVILSIIVYKYIENKRYKQMFKDVNTHVASQSINYTELFGANGGSSYISNDTINLDLKKINSPIFNDGDISSKDIKNLYEIAAGLEYEPDEITDVWIKSADYIEEIDLTDFTYLEELRISNVGDCSVVKINDSQKIEEITVYDNISNVSECNYLKNTENLYLWDNVNLSLKDLNDFDNTKYLSLAGSTNVLEEIEELESIEEIVIDDPSENNYYITQESYDYVMENNIKIIYANTEVKAMTEINMDDLEII